MKDSGAACLSSSAFSRYCRLFLLSEQLSSGPFLSQDAWTVTLNSKVSFLRGFQQFLSSFLTLTCSCFGPVCLFERLPLSKVLFLVALAPGTRPLVLDQPTLAGPWLRYSAPLRSRALFKDLRLALRPLQFSLKPCREVSDHPLCPLLLTRLSPKICGRRF